MFASEVGAAVEAVKAAASDSDVYCGVGLYRNGIKHGRGKASDVVGLPALWADIDYAGPPHKKVGLPASQDDAERILAAIGLPPSLRVHSGHGMQPWWLLADLIEPSEGMAERAATWAATVGRRANDLGWTVDSVSDVSRVLRVPGTVNHKGEPVPVTADVPDEPRIYQWCDVELYLAGGASHLPAAAGPLILKADAYPDARWLENALDNDQQFAGTWQRRRRDLQDSSPSAYDLALAWFGVRVGLSDQAIADLMIGWRAKHGESIEKAMRRDYVQRTIGKAREGHARGNTEFDTIAIHVEEAASKETPNEKLQYVRNKLKLPVVAFEREGKVKCRYFLRLNGLPDVAIGTAKTLLEQRSFRAAVLDCTRRAIEAFKGATWRRIIQTLLDVCVEHELPETDAELDTWIDDYLDVNEPANDESFGAALRTRRPLRRDGRTWIFAAGLHDHLRNNGERVDRRDLLAAMRRAGWVGKSLSTSDSGRQVTRYYWGEPVQK